MERLPRSEQRENSIESNALTTRPSQPRAALGLRNYSCLSTHPSPASTALLA